MSCDVAEVTESLENELALPTSQLIVQRLRCLTYITAHSPTLLSLLLRHRLFTYVTWRAAHAAKHRYDAIIARVMGDVLMLTK